MKVCLARIIGAHGIKGLVKVRAFTHSALDALQYNPLVDKNGKLYTLKLERFMPNGVMLCHLDGCVTRNDAEAQHGVELFVDRERMPDLDENTYYYADLEGLSVVDQEGLELGRVKAVHDHGAGVFMDVTLTDKSEATLPFYPESEVDLENKKLVIDSAWLIGASYDRSERDEPNHML